MMPYDEVMTVLNIVGRSVRTHVRDKAAIMAIQADLGRIAGRGT
jgi:hypothetical protein